MDNNRLLNAILKRKKLLNFLLKFFSPTNYFIVCLSKDLDKYVAAYQRKLYLDKYQNKNYLYD